MSEEPAPITKPCRVCGEDIRFAARKCVHCDSWQDWRGNIGVSATILSLLVALVSVTTPLLPAITNFMRPDDSVFKFSFQRSSKQGFSIFVSNTGRRPGSVGSAVIYLSSKNHFIGEIDLAMRDVGDRDTIAIQPESTLLLNYALKPNQKIPKPLPMGDQTCIVGVHVTNFRNDNITNEVDEESWEIDCALIDTLLSENQPMRPKR
jgi:hypothetical protein